MEENSNNQAVFSGTKQQLPSNVATLVLGILALVFSFCCWTGGMVGIILGVIALAISAGPIKLFNENPTQYEGIGNLRAGRIMSVIALSLSAVCFIVLLIYISVIGFAAFSFGNLFDIIQ